MKNNLTRNLRTFAVWLRGSAFLIVMTFAAAAHAQFASIVDVQFTGQCNAIPDTIGIVLRGEEAYQFDAYRKEDGHWIGDIPVTLGMIEASNTIGSARVHGWRTDCQRSRRGMRNSARVVSFTFKCDPYKAMNADISTAPAINFSYVRLLSSNPTNDGSCDCLEGGASRGKQKIQDLRFSRRSISTGLGPMKADPGTPFEELRLQLFAAKPSPKACGMLVNDPEVIAAARKGPINVQGIVKLLSSQRNASKACQAPTLSTPAIAIDERTFPKGELELTLKKAE
ncbi:MAG TPA: hypothetical protein VN380_19560 [Thermoanaerobaculia bacterium]|nr:hypothetical protein [Thermoanaerobaculia bacterium]